LKKRKAKGLEFPLRVSKKKEGKSRDSASVRRSRTLEGKEGKKSSEGTSTKKKEKDTSHLLKRDAALGREGYRILDVGPWEGKIVVSRQPRREQRGKKKDEKRRGPPSGTGKEMAPSQNHVEESRKLSEAEEKRGVSEREERGNVARDLRRGTKKEKKKREQLATSERGKKVSA